MEDTSSGGGFPNWYPFGSFSNCMSGFNFTNLLMVSANVFFIPFIYSNFRLYLEASSTPQLFTLSFLVFFNKKDFRGKMITPNGSISLLEIII